MTGLAADDVALVRRLHEDYVVDGFLTGAACVLAAHDTRAVNDALATFLLDRAEEMDRPVRVADVMASVQQWAAR